MKNKKIFKNICVSALYIDFYRHKNKRDLIFFGNGRKHIVITTSHSNRPITSIKICI